ncbi:hypothetical protein GCM10025876_18400 [Demequina litorisediminis]|uniref:Uncharacterized protein n=1 Tax=Demequina litorisediminis TaxID=1849022 RepID=A0ABQ6ID83_9MICO|nr:hypothetical protein GCM10025876_18400 [Demequina litorisediminis]
MGFLASGFPRRLKPQAELAGATVVDRASVLVTHLGSIITAHAPRLLSREDVRMLVDGVKQVNHAVVDEPGAHGAVARRGAAGLAGTAGGAGLDP